MYARRRLSAHAYGLHLSQRHIERIKITGIKTTKEWHVTVFAWVSMHALMNVYDDMPYFERAFIMKKKEAHIPSMYAALHHFAVGK